jgi:hypothetical protein
VSRYTPWRRLGERSYSSYSFSTSALDGGEWSASRPGRAFTPGERTPGAHCTGGWVGPRAGLDSEARGKILCLYRGSNPDRPVVQPVVRHYTAWATNNYFMYSHTVLPPVLPPFLCTADIWKIGLIVAFFPTTGRYSYGMNSLFMRVHVACVCLGLILIILIFYPVFLTRPV